MKKTLSTWLNRLFEKCSNFNTKLEEINTTIPEGIALFSYIVLNVLVKAFHEPWFDEAQAWMIARSATIKDIITAIPHYEGHPPLWHLILVPFAKLGVPYDIGSNLVSLVFIAIAAGLVIYKSPFPRILRLSIPYTYFFFYQYGVISRVYSLMMLAFIIMAIAYKTRHEKPFHFVAAMAFLCATNAFGVLFCFGVSCCWLYEILKVSLSKQNISKLFIDKRIQALFLLFVFVMGLIVMIVPKQDTAVYHLKAANTFFDRLVYMVFVAPADATILECFYDYNRLIQQVCWGTNFIFGLFAGILAWIFLISYASYYKKTMILVLPYLVFALFGAKVYFYTHHLGIIFMYLLFWFWINLDDEAVEFELAPLLKKIIKNNSDFKLVTKTACIMLSLCLINMMVWTIVASINDIRQNYGFTKEMSRFIKEKHLDNRLIMASWKRALTSNDSTNTNVIAGIELLPYFDHNIISNLNNGSSQNNFLSGIKADEATNSKNYALWRTHGIPEVFIGDIGCLNLVFNGTVTKNDYVLALQPENSFIWKDSMEKHIIKLYVLKKTAKELGIQEIKPKEFDFVITKKINNSPKTTPDNH